MCYIFFNCQTESNFLLGFSNIENNQNFIFMVVIKLKKNLANEYPVYISNF